MLCRSGEGLLGRASHRLAELYWIFRLVKYDKFDTTIRFCERREARGAARGYQRHRRSAAQLPKSSALHGEQRARASETEGRAIFKAGV